MDEKTSQSTGLQEKSGPTDSRGELRNDPPKNKIESETSKVNESKKSNEAKRGSRRFLWIVPVMLVLVTLGMLAALYWLEKDADETHLELMGNIDVRQVNLAFKVEGRIETLNVDEGDVVKANDVIATLDKRYFNDELRIMRARRQNQAANVAKL